MIKIVVSMMLTAQLFCAVANADRAGNSVSISGPITLDWIRKIEDAHNEGISKFVISSEGGREIDALIVSEFVSNLEIEITVDAYCLSSCAQFLLPSAKKVTLLEGAVIGLHHSSYSILRLSGIEHEKIAQLDELVAVSQRTEALFEKVGAELSLLDDAIIQSKVNCVTYESFHTRVFLEYSFWIPSATTMIESGINLVNYPDFYSAHVYHRSAGVLEFPNTKFRIGDIDRPASFDAVEECP